MPNWCENHLRILGPSYDVAAACARIAAVASGGALGDGDLANCADTRGEGHAGLRVARDATASGDVPTAAIRGVPDREQILLRYLPTPESPKHDAASVCARCEFDTAWSPPVRWLHELASHFPSLRLTLDYYVDAVPCAGRHAFANGVHVENAEYHDPSMVDEVMRRMYEG